MYNIVEQDPVALCAVQIWLLVNLFRLFAAQVVVYSFSLQFKYIFYMFRPNWPTSCVQVGLARQLLLPWVLLHVGTVLQLCTCSVLQFCQMNFSLVPICGSFFVCFRSLHQMHPALVVGHRVCSSVFDSSGILQI